MRPYLKSALNLKDYFNMLVIVEFRVFVKIPVLYSNLTLNSLSLLKLQRDKVIVISLD